MASSRLVPSAPARSRVTAAVASRRGRAAGAQEPAVGLPRVQQVHEEVPCWPVALWAVAAAGFVPAAAVAGQQGSAALVASVVTAGVAETREPRPYSEARDTLEAGPVGGLDAILDASAGEPCRRAACASQDTGLGLVQSAAAAAEVGGTVGSTETLGAAVGKGRRVHRVSVSSAQVSTSRCNSPSNSMNCSCLERENCQQSSSATTQLQNANPKCSPVHNLWAATYPKNRRIIQHLRRRRFFCRLFFDMEVLYVTPAKHDVLVYIVGPGHLLRRVLTTALGAMRDHLLESNSAVFRVDFMEGAGVAEVTSQLVADAPSPSAGQAASTEFRSWRSERCELCSSRR